MSRRLALFLLAVALCTPLHAQPRTPAPSPADDAAIRALVGGIAHAWNAHDMQAYARLFAQDADWVNIRGNRWRGADAIRDEHVAVHERFYRRSQVSFSEVTVRMLAPDVAVVHARETMRGSDVPARANISPESQMSLVVVRRDGQWKIANGQNTNIATPAPSPPATAPPR